MIDTPEFLLTHSRYFFLPNNYVQGPVTDFKDNFPLLNTCQWELISIDTTPQRSVRFTGPQLHVIRNELGLESLS